MIRQAQVLSKAPPGGRCTLSNTGYLHRLAEGLGGEPEGVVTERSNPHGQGLPVLLLDGRPIQPGDGVIRFPEEDLILAVAQRLHWLAWRGPSIPARKRS